jgi:hypothetical protein
MKNIITLGLILLLTLKSFAQTDGISYQAVIINPELLELPGVDSESNYLPNTDVIIRFTIFDSGNEIEFEEIQTASTDEFGRINLIIGAVKHDDFEAIEWDGTGKQLRVEIDFQNGGGFNDMGRDDLTFVPYAYHRNITAAGTLIVDDDTTLKRELTVEGPTMLNSTLDVTDGNASYLTGALTVDGVTNLNNILNVNDKSASNFSGALNVGETTGLEDVDAPTLLNGTLNVVGLTTVGDFVSTGEAGFNDLKAVTLEVSDSSILNGVNTLNGETVLDGNNTIGNSMDDVIDVTGGVSISSNAQVILTSSLTATGSAIADHPMLIDGGKNGLAIRVNRGRNNSTNFITFFDTERDDSWGRIEGEIPSEYTNNDDYNFDQRSLNYDIADGVLDLVFAGFDVYAAATGTAMAVTSSTGCAGFGACVTAPIPSMIAKYATESVVAGLQLVTAGVAAGVSIDNKVTYDNNKDKNQGVTYASGAGDYAEYLLRSDIYESISYGDIVGVNGGKISKNTEGAERMMVVSFKPIVLGNMPEVYRENEYEKVAFMGQVPVKVFGMVNVGDYIIPSGKNDGVGIAIPPTKMTSKNIRKIVGIAWSTTNNILGFNMVNVAVGLNTNDNNPIIVKLENQLEEQSNEIDYLKNQMTEILITISRLENGENITLTNKASAKKSAEDNQDENNHNHRKYEVVESEDTDIIYFEITRQDFEKALVTAEESMRENGLYEANKDVLERINSDLSFKNDFLNQIENKLKKAVHYHKDIDKKGSKKK